MGISGGTDTTFSGALERHLEQVRRAVVARYGYEVGVEVTADTQLWAWAHQEQVTAADNPAGLLFRVAQTRAESHHRWSARRAPIELLPESRVTAVRPELVDLFRALPRLREPERVAVVMVHAHGESYQAVADLLGVSVAAVTNHVHRGLKKLRALMEEQA